MFRKVLKVPRIFIILAVVLLLGSIFVGSVLAKSPVEIDASTGAILSTESSEQDNAGESEGQEIEDVNDEDDEDTDDVEEEVEEENEDGVESEGGIED